MQSSHGVAFRAFIMLMTLVAIPSVALFWNELPPLGDKLLTICEQHWGIRFLRSDKRTTRRDPDADHLNLADAPRFAPSSESPFAAHTEPMSLAAEFVGQTNGRMSSASFPDTAFPAMQTSYETAVDRAGSTLRSGPPVRAESDGGQVQSVDQFSTIQLRLRELGATYYLLESWGTNATRYRFHCRMAVAGDDRHFRQFEAMASDPLAAMTEVLRQVEQWRFGHQP